MVYPYVPATYNPPEGDAFIDILQPAVIGIVGLAGKFVRPLWQIDPPILPGPAVDWCAIGMRNFKPDSDAVVTTSGEDGLLQRNESGELLASFYGPTGERNCGLLRDGLQIPFNREVLRGQGITIQAEGDTLHVPELIDDRWYDRHDITFTIGREIRRAYRILSFISATGKIYGNGPDPAFELPFSVTQ